MVEGWAREGLTDKQIAEEKIGITTTTYYQWQKDYPAFSDAIKKGKAPVDVEVENALLKRALGYDWEEVTTEVWGEGENERKHIKKVKRHVPPEPVAIFYWLKNRKPKCWQDHPDAKEDNEVLQTARKLLEGIDSVID